MPLWAWRFESSPGHHRTPMALLFLNLLPLIAFVGAQCYTRVLHMVLKMACPMRRKGSSVYQLRKRIPKDVLSKARGRTLNVPIGDDIRTIQLSPSATTVVTTLGTRDPNEAKRRSLTAVTYLESVWTALRNGPRKLAHKEIVALSGEIYRQIADGQEDEPGSPELWDTFLSINAKVARGRFGNPRNLKIGDGDERDRVASLEGWFGPSVDELLAREAIVIDNESRKRLLYQPALISTHRPSRACRWT